MMFSPADLLGWNAVTAELGDTHSPLTLYLHARFRNLRPVQDAYRKSAPELVVAADPALPAGTVGTAFDWYLRFLVCPQPSFHLAALGAAALGQDSRLLTALGEVAEQTGITDHELTVMPDHRGAGTVFEPCSGVLPGRDTELYARASWALAAATEIYRAGLLPGSPLAGLDLAAVTGDDLLELAPPAAADHLRQLGDLAATNLLPELAQRTGNTGSWVVGPTFEGSAFMPGDGDLIADGLLLEIKTSVGSRRSSGQYYAALDKATLHQLLAYLLFDLHDAYRITAVGCYNARYGHLATWDLQPLLDQLAGTPADLARHRAFVGRMLSTGHPSVRTTPECRAMILLTDLETHELEAIDEAAHIVPNVLCCQLAGNHAGRHHAQGQEALGSDTAWWVCWDQQQRAIHQLSACPATGHSEDEDEDEPVECVLFQRHAGAHRYDMDERDGREPTPALAALLAAAAGEGGDTDF